MSSSLRAHLPARLLSLVVAGLLAAGLSVVPVGILTGTTPAVAASAPSAAGSIVFIRNHNIWVARGNGTSATSVTRDGTSAKPYTHPSISSTGVIATTRDNDIVLLKQNGTAIRRIPVPKGHLYLNNGAGSYAVTGPVEAEISPDGSKVAYRQIRYATVGSWPDARTGFTDATSLSPITKYGIVLGGEFSWTDNNRGIFVSSEIRTHQMGSTDQVGSVWFTQGDITEDHGDTPGVPQVSANGHLLAWTSFTTGRIILATVNGTPGAATPTGLCALTPDGATPLGHPSFSPDSSTLLWQENGNEVWVGWNLETQPGCAGMGQKRLLTNASQPDWSAAPFDTIPEPKTKKPTKKAKQVLKLKKRPKIKGKARVGRTLKATEGNWAGKPKKYAFRWFRNNKAIKGRAGAKRTYVVRRADKGKKLSVRVTVKRPGVAGKNAARSKPVRVR